MKVYLVENIETGERRRVYGKGTRVFVAKHQAVAKIKYDRTQRVVEYELVPTGHTITNVGEK